jgi:hypothetical protein
VIAGCQDAGKDVAHLGFVVDELEQGLSARATLADAKNILGGWIQARDQQMVIE